MGLDWSATGLQQRLWAELLDMRGNAVGKIEGLTSFSYDAKASADVRVSGSLDVTLQGPLDWRAQQCRVWVEVSDGQTTVTTPVITAMMEAGDEARTATSGTTIDVKLFDTTIRLDTSIGRSLSLGAGTVITTQVRAFLAEAGILDAAITESSAALSAGMVWDPATTWRRVINDLTGAANYAAAWADEWGRIQIHPYVLPDRRPVVADLTHGPAATFLPAWTSSTNAAKIPNHLVMVATTDGDTPAMVAERWDTDPASPWSTVSRGRTISRVEQNVEASDQAALEAQADRIWATSRALSRSFRVDLRWLPLQLGDRVRFHPGPNRWGEQLTTDATVQSIAWRAANGKAFGLAQLTLDEVMS